MNPATTELVHESRFRAMGTDAHVIVVGGRPGLVEDARGRIDELEARWSRFRPTSELCRLNAAAGSPALVSPITFELVSLAVESWHTIGGRFDPTVLTALETAGYDRSFEQLDRANGNVAPAPAPAPGCGAIALDPVIGSVSLPPGVTLDLGGIGKGFAADVVSAEILDDSAAGVCVNLGGDLRVRGDAPGDDGWIVEIETEPGRDARPGPPPPVFALADGAVATTSSRRRTWQRAGVVQHHVIDPRTGRPVAHPPAAVTMIAGAAWEAEVLAKAVFVAGRDETADLLARSGATGLVVDAGGALHPLPGFDRFLT